MTRQVRQRLARLRRWICVALSLLALVRCGRRRGEVLSNLGFRAPTRHLAGLRAIRDG